MPYFEVTVRQETVFYVEADDKDAAWIDAEELSCDVGVGKGPSWDENDVDVWPTPVVLANQWLWQGGDTGKFIITTEKLG